MFTTEAKRSVGTLVLTDGPVVEWFMALESDGHEAQDDWVAEVTGRSTAVVTGYSFTPREKRLEVEYTYLERLPEGGGS